MIYQMHRLLRDVRIAIDENASSEQLITDGDIDTLTLEEIIRSKVEESAREVLMAAPLSALEIGWSFGNGAATVSVHWNGDKSGWVYLPNDFCRFVVFEMSDWERPVFNLIEAGSSHYNMQRSRWGGIRGTPQSPRCAIVPRSEGATLEFYSCKSESATVKRALYHRIPRIEHYALLSASVIATKDDQALTGRNVSNGLSCTFSANSVTERYEGIWINERLYEATVYAIAAATLLSCGALELAQQLAGRSSSLIEDLKQ